MNETLKSFLQNFSFRDTIVGIELTFRNTTRSLFYKKQLFLKSKLAVIYFI